MREKIEQTFAGLKDFQRKTVEYVLKRFHEGQNRILVADEVGLGKTIVAKGVIAGLYERHLEQQPQKPFRVVYVCSNQVIAQSNINKLNFTGKDDYLISGDDNDRITLLAYKRHKSEQKLPLSIRAFSPATSFDEATSAGRKEERILLYQILVSFAEFQEYQNSLKWILQGTRRIATETWEAEIERIDHNKDREIFPSVKGKFKKVLKDTIAERNQFPCCYKMLGVQEQLSVWNLVLGLAQQNYRKNSQDRFIFSHELIAHLRQFLAQSCLHLLKADLFILDEFQRYPKLIQPAEEFANPAAQMVNEILTETQAKLLILSATPFKPYTNDFDQLNGEIHHKEFRTVLEFLRPNLEGQKWQELEKNRTQLFNYLRRPVLEQEAFNQAKAAKEQLQKFYRSCMTRTERLLVAKDKDTLIRDVMRGRHIDPTAAEIESFLQTDAITQYLIQKYKLKLPIPIAYAKSAPYTMSFLEGYRQRNALLAHLAKDPELQRLIRKQDKAWLDLRKIQNYEPLAPGQLPSGRLEELRKLTLSDDKVLLLWVPPTLPYYAPAWPFDVHRHYTKTLVFSAWRLVPRMISTILSYEAERLTVGNPKSISVKERASDPEKGARSYFGRPRNPRPKITFQLEDGRPRQMEHMVFAYPSPLLATLYDPQDNLKDKKTPAEIEQMLVEKFVQLLTAPAIEKNCNRTTRSDWRQWFWAAAPILDRCYLHSKAVEDWFSQDYPYPEIAIDPEIDAAEKHEKKAKRESFAWLKKAYFGPRSLPDQESHGGWLAWLPGFRNSDSLTLPPLKPEQAHEVAKYLARLTLGSPAVAFLRTLMRSQGVSVAEAQITKELINAAFEVAFGFITYFNKPESISIVRLAVLDAEESSYTDKVLLYCQRGNIQALLDEYVSLIRDQESLEAPADMANFISDILTVRTTQYKLDTPDSLIAEAMRQQEQDTGEKIKNRVRTHFAVDFGGQKLKTAKSQGHQIDIRKAFNSPFAPFVLASTSIGQEGLDFHLYCRRIVHWNLPANAIDIEQREGRINRYKGHIIRQILVEKYGKEVAPTGGQDAWQQLFAIAEAREGRGARQCELVPFWYSEPHGDLRIERYVPMHTLSQETTKYDELLRILAYYRLAFGQPRQDELIAALAAHHSAELLEKVQELMLNLSPLTFKKA